MGRSHATIASVSGLEQLQFLGGHLPVVEGFLEGRLYFFKLVCHVDAGHTVIGIECSHVLIEFGFLPFKLGDLLFQFADAVFQLFDEAFWSS